MKYIITLLGSYETPDLHLFCSLSWKTGEQYSWQIGYENVIGFDCKKDAAQVINEMKITGVLKIEKVFLKGIAYHIFNSRFTLKC
jgi:hypothetical protein